MNQPTQFKRRREPLPSHLAALTVRVPGSSANLGPGFDALALAFKLYCTMHFRLLPEAAPEIPLITLAGKSTAGLSQDRSNLVFAVLAKLWRNQPDLASRVRITIDSEIPLGKGLGSSAAAVTGAVFAGLALERELPADPVVLALAAEIEGHADNASASLLGGLVACASATRSRRPVCQRLSWPEQWATVVFVPAGALSTKKSRSVLPRSYSREDAVYNLQKVALLTAAVYNRDEEAMQEALHDRLHEPYRMALVPQLSALRKVVSDLPVLGCVLSGAGSSVLTIVHQRHRQQVIECLRSWSARTGEGEVLDLTVDQEGLKVSYE